MQKTSVAYKSHIFLDVFTGITKSLMRVREGVRKVGRCRNKMKDFLQVLFLYYQKIAPKLYKSTSLVKNSTR